MCLIKMISMNDIDKQAMDHVHGMVRKDHKSSVYERV